MSCHMPAYFIFSIMAFIFRPMTDLCRYVDVCISNEEDAKDVFGIEAEATDIYGVSLNHEGYKHDIIHQTIRRRQPIIRRHFFFVFL